MSTSQHILKCCKDKTVSLHFLTFLSSLELSLSSKTTLAFFHKRTLRLPVKKARNRTEDWQTQGQQVLSECIRTKGKMRLHIRQLIVLTVREGKLMSRVFTATNSLDMTCTQPKECNCYLYTLCIHLHTS